MLHLGEVKLHSFLQIGRRFAKGLALGYDRQVDAFGDIVLPALVDMDLNGLFHAKFIALMQGKVN